MRRSGSNHAQTRIGAAPGLSASLLLLAWAPAAASGSPLVGGSPAGRALTVESRFVRSVVGIDCDIEAMAEALNAIELPIACSLDAGEGGERLARWRNLAARGASLVDQGHDQIVVRYHRRSGVIQELEALAAVERRCCSFADWQVTHDTEHAELHIRSNAQGLAAIAALLIAE